jgi:hypothetical protein
MSQPSRPAIVPVSRKARVIVSAMAVVTSLAAVAAWSVGASADTGSTATSAPTSAPTTAASTVSGPVSTRTSVTWNFDDGKVGNWYGTPNEATAQAWLAPSPSAAASGRGGLIVGNLTPPLGGAAVDLDRTMLAPGTYSVTAKVRLAPGQRGASLLIDGTRPVPTVSASDAQWATLTGTVVVPGDGTRNRLHVTMGYGGACYAASDHDLQARTLYLDDVALTKSSDSTTIAPPTTLTCQGTPRPRPTARLHYEVTSVSPGSFSATVVLTNLTSSPITDWSVPLNGLTDSKRVTWVSGARVVTVPTANGTEVRLVAAAGSAKDLTGAVRFSIGLSGNPLGSAGIFTSITGRETAWN